jgi:hypothetical protein
MDRGADGEMERGGRGIDGEMERGVDGERGRGPLCRH